MKHLLRKPALQYPHAEVVNQNEKVDFQCELQSSGKIAKARLMMDDNNYEYYFDNFDERLPFLSAVADIPYKVA